jgi:hypothetical protein
MIRKMNCQDIGKPQELFPAAATRVPMARTLIDDVLSALDEVARKHQIVWDSIYIDFRNCPDEMMATHETDAKSKKLADRLVANLRFWRKRKRQG